MKKLIFFISLSVLILVGCEKKHSEHKHDYERAIWVNPDVNIEHKHKHTIWANPDDNIEHKYKRTIWINPDVECCGEKDPLNNLDWLKKIYDIKYKRYEQIDSSSYEYTSSYEYIFLFRNASTNTDYIVRNSSMWHYNWVGIYECNGTIVDKGIFSREMFTNKITNDKKRQAEDYAEDCLLCGEFFETHVLIDTIFYCIVK